jgi:hypothetical protein
MATRSIGPGSGGNTTATFQATIQFGNSPVGPVALALDILQNLNASFYSTTISLANGDNTITVPATAGGVMLIAPPANTVAWKTLGASGGTGIAQSLVGMQMMTFPVSPPASILIFTGGAIANFQIVFF